jgi:hypothetical protein
MRNLAGRFAVVVTLLGAMATGAGGADLKPIHTEKTRDVVIKLLSESGEWKQGKNAFVLEFESAKDQKPVDAGKVALSTSMAMPGMAPMLTGAALTPDGPGRYRGTIQFPDTGTRQVTVSWDGPAGKGSSKFSIPVH